MRILIVKWAYILPVLLFISCEEKKIVEEKISHTVKIKDSIGILESSKKEMVQQSRFEPLGDSLTYIYLSQLPQLPLPFKISTEQDPLSTELEGMNEDIYNKLLLLGTPYGKLIEATNYAVVVHTMPADIWFPILYTMDFNGQILDTLNAFVCGGSDADYSCKEYFSVSKDGYIEFIDSTYHYDLDQTGNRIEKSKQLNVVKRLIVIDKKGFFDEIPDESEEPPF